MNNKRLGTAFENEFCEILKDKGWWVHFMSPSSSGSQPCDIVASKDNEPMLIDCKTSADKVFRISRLEDNQILAFEKFIKTGNKNCFIAVKYKEDIFLIPYRFLKNLEKIDLEKDGNGYLYIKQNKDK